MTIRAPVLLLPISYEPLTISLIVSSENRSPAILLSNWKSEDNTLRRPSCSSALRSSGWKTTTIAVTATENMFLAIQSIVVMENIAATMTKRRINIIPLRSDHAFDSLIHASTLYRSTEMISTSTRSVHLMDGIVSHVT